MSSFSGNFFWRDKMIFFKKDKSELTLEQLSYEWLLKSKNSLKRSTYQSYEYVIKHYISNSVISDFPTNRLNEYSLLDYTNALLSKNLSPKTVNDILTILNQVLKYSNKIYSTDFVPVQFVKQNKKEMRVLTKTEQKRLEVYLNKNMDNYKFGTLLTLYTGMRIGELCALQWKDINHGVIKISKTMYRLKDENGQSRVVIESPKTDTSNRIIPIPLFLVNIVELYRANDNTYLLSNEKLQYAEPRLMQMKFKKMTIECGLENVTFHTLRHTFATRCIECGFDIKTLSEILGHSNVSTTLNKYVHSSLELKQENMNKLMQISV